MSLQQQIEARRATEATCHATGTRGSVSFIEFHVSPHSRTGFPVAQLCHYTLEANAAATDGDAPPERLTLGFSTADVVIVGARLSKLVEAINEHTLAAVMPLDARYAGALGQRPWVARVVVSRIDKPTAI